MPYVITWAFPAFKEGDSRSFSIFQDTPAGQARGWETSAASRTVSSWLIGVLPCWGRWKHLWYPKWKRCLDQHRECLQWSDSAGYVHWVLCPAWVVQELVAQQMPLCTRCLSAPNPCLPPILTKLSLEFLMALAVAFPHCWMCNHELKPNPWWDFLVTALWSCVSPLLVSHSPLALAALI